MTIPPLNRGMIAGLAGAILGIGAFVVVIHFFEPGKAGVYPQCMFHKHTGFACPGCGALRAVHQLTHGNVLAAFRLNPLLLATLPFLAWLGFRYWRRLASPDKESAGPLIPAAAGWAALGALIVFGVARNLPMFSWMAP